MGLKLRDGDIIFVDTSPFIYFFENHPDYLPAMQTFFDQVYSCNAQVITSIITYIEITTLPVRQGNRPLARKYREYFSYSDNLTLLPLDMSIADEVVHLRTTYGLRTPDAIQLGTALAAGADYALTNDRKWNQMEDLKIIQIGDL